MRYGGILGGDAGLYFRRYADKLASVLVVGNPGAQGTLSPTLNSPLQYKQFYAEGIEMFGASYSKKFFGGGLATGVEANYRHDTPLTAQALGFAVAPSAALGSVRPRLACLQASRAFRSLSASAPRRTWPS